MRFFRKPAHGMVSSVRQSANQGAAYCITVAQCLAIDDVERAGAADPLGVTRL